VGHLFPETLYIVNARVWDARPAPTPDIYGPGENACNPHSRNHEAGMGGFEKMNHEDLEDLKATSVFYFPASGGVYFEDF
jgi:hypothetical protein